MILSIKLWSLRDNLIQPLYFHRKESRVSDLPEIIQIVRAQDSRILVSFLLHRCQIIAFFAQGLFVSSLDQDILIFRKRYKHKTLFMSHCKITSLEKWFHLWFTFLCIKEENRMNMKFKKCISKLNCLLCLTL